MDAIYTFNNYSEDSQPRLQFPARTGRQTTYAQWLDYNYRLHHDNALPAPEDAQPLAPTFINHGRWLWLCPACLTAVQVSETAGAVDPCCCPACFSQGFVQPAFPADRAAIEAELMRQPGYRWNAPFRNWEPGWTLPYLQQRTAAAQAQLDAGATYVRAASIGTPRTWSVGEVLTAANMNTYIREIQRDLIGTNGPVEFLNALVAASMTTAERNALTAAHGMILFNSTLGKLENYDGQWRTPLRYHQSQLFRMGSHTTVTHNLGVKPVQFQVVIERVAATVSLGYAQGDQVFIHQNESPHEPFLAVHSVTTSQYIAALGPDNSQPGTNTFLRARIMSKTGVGIQRIYVDNGSPVTPSSLAGWGARVIAIG